LGPRRFVTLVRSAVYKLSYLLTYLLTYPSPFLQSSQVQLSRWNRLYDANSAVQFII